MKIIYNFLVFTLGLYSSRITYMNRVIERRIIRARTQVQ